RVSVAFVPAILAQQRGHGLFLASLTLLEARAVGSLRFVEISDIRDKAVERPGFDRICRCFRCVAVDHSAPPFFSSGSISRNSVAGRRTKSGAFPSEGRRRSHVAKQIVGV